MEWLQTFSFLLGLGGLLGGATLGFWASRSKGLQELLKTENAAYKESNARLHEENKELRLETTTAEAELKVWRDNVTQRPSIEKLITETAKQHSQYMQELGKVATGLSELVKQQSELTQTIAQAMLNRGNK